VSLATFPSLFIVFVWFHRAIIFTQVDDDEDDDDDGEANFRYRTRARPAFALLLAHSFIHSFVALVMKLLTNGTFSPT